MLWCHWADVWRRSLPTEAVSFPRRMVGGGTVGGFEQWLAGWTTGSTAGRDREGGGLDGGNQQRKRETDAGAVKRSRRESGLGKEVSNGVKGKKGREKAAGCQAPRLHGALYGGLEGLGGAAGGWSEVAAPPTRTLPPPRTASPNSAPVSAALGRFFFPPQENQTLQLALLNRERQRDRKKEGERKRGHTTGRHQLKPCSLALSLSSLFFPSSQAVFFRSYPVL